MLEEMPQQKKSCVGMSILTLILGGFTVISLINLDSERNALNKAKQTEAKFYIEKMNTTQKQLFLQENHLTNSISRLEIASETDNYQYSMKETEQGVLHFAIAKTPQIKSYVGSVILIEAPEASEKVKTLSILCESKSVEPVPIDIPLRVENQLVCGKNTVVVDFSPISQSNPDF